MTRICLLRFWARLKIVVDKEYGECPYFDPTGQSSIWEDHRSTRAGGGGVAANKLPVKRGKNGNKTKKQCPGAGG